MLFYFFLVTKQWSGTLLQRQPLFLRERIMCCLFLSFELWKLRKIIKKCCFHSSIYLFPFFPYMGLFLWHDFGCCCCFSLWWGPFFSLCNTNTITHLPFPLIPPEVEKGGSFLKAEGFLTQMGLSRPHKVGNGVSTRWVSFFCIVSFFLGVLVVNRFCSLSLSLSLCVARILCFKLNQLVDLLLTFIWALKFVIFMLFVANGLSLMTILFIFNMLWYSLNLWKFWFWGSGFKPLGISLWSLSFRLGL